jgi:hypothetical protein
MAANIPRILSALHFLVTYCLYYKFDVRIIIRFKQINQQAATVSQVYYLTFMCGAIHFGRLTTHHQERTTSLGASGFTVGARQVPDHDQQHSNCHAAMVKPEAPSAVVHS